MLTKTRALIAAALIATTSLSAPAYAAAVPVIDPAAIARIREAVTTASQQLAQAKQQLSQMQQMRNTIGQVGQGQIGTILQQSGLDFAGEKGVLNSVRTLSSQANNLGSIAKNLQISGEGAINIPNISSSADPIAAGREAAGQLFFYNGDQTMTQEAVSGLRERRNIVLRETAVTAYGAATALRADLDGTRQIAEGLQNQAKTSADLRTDVQVSTAALLAMYAELQKQTTMAAQMLELEAARVLASDATGRRGR